MDPKRETIICSPGGFRIGSVYATLGGFFRACVTDACVTTQTPFATFAEAEAHVRKTAPPKA